MPAADSQSPYVLIACLDSRQVLSARGLCSIARPPTNESRSTSTRAYDDAPADRWPTNRATQYCHSASPSSVSFASAYTFSATPPMASLSRLLSVTVPTPPDREKWKPNVRIVAVVTCCRQRDYELSVIGGAWRRRLHHPGSIAQYLHMVRQGPPILGLAGRGLEDADLCLVPRDHGVNIVRGLGGG